MSETIIYPNSQSSNQLRNKPTAMKLPHEEFNACEQMLLATIHRTKSPAFRLRYDLLTEKRETYQLTELEHLELLCLIEELQKFDLEYIRALGELASIRGLQVPELMRQLGIKAK